MGFRQYSSEASTDVPLVTTAETVVATVSGISSGSPGVPIRLRAMAQLTTGTNTTAVTPRVRRDSLTGTVINEANPVAVGAAAGSTEQFDIDCDDLLSGEVANAVYVFTLQQTAASANGSALYAYIQADVG